MQLLHSQPDAQHTSSAEKINSQLQVYQCNACQTEYICRQKNYTNYFSPPELQQIIVHVERYVSPIQIRMYLPHGDCQLQLWTFPIPKVKKIINLPLFYAAQYSLSELKRKAMSYTLLS